MPIFIGHMLHFDKRHGSAALSVSENHIFY